MKDIHTRVDLIRSRNLRELRFETHQTCPDFEALALLIHGNPHIIRLTVKLHWVNSASSKVLKRALEPLPHLRVLNLNHGEDITNRWIAELLENMSGLEEVYLENSTDCSLIIIRVYGLKSARFLTAGFTQVVRLGPKLESLALRGGRQICITDELPKNLRECCPYFKSLQYVDRLGGLESTEGGGPMSRVLASCPQLETFELDTVGAAKFPEDIVGVFEQPWGCPSLRVIKLTGFSNDFSSEFQKRVATLSKYGLQVQQDQGFLGKLDDVENEDEDGSETEQGDGSATENGSDSEESEDNFGFEEDVLGRCSPWTRVYAELPEPDLAFHKSLEKCDWIRNKFYSRISKKPSRLEKIVQQLVLERLSNSTRIQKVTLEDHVFVQTRH
ncbi:hypothetical protein BGZ81_010851 [Podila clonocystis]|nr:hypothetical protein BGZ81_010851 [Podila clonocystis]